MEELINYIDWNNLCNDYGLEYGDLTPDQYFTLEKMLNEFIEQNKAK